MCLLISKPANAEFKEEHLADFYTRNKDGIGVMYAQDNQLHLVKQLPGSVQDVLDFYEKYAKGRACAIHYRMRTHGDIDYENCHPYPVFGFEDGDEPAMPMALMHNGVLHTGNDADRSKSDTWHYIRTYLRPLLKHEPDLAFTREFRDLIGKHIGNNRFVLMNHLGQMSIINKSQGVDFEGSWLSNEYAWSSAKYLPRKTYPGWNGTYYTLGGKEGTTAKKSGTAPVKSTPTGGKKKSSGVKQMALLPTNAGGKTTWTNKEKNESHGVSVDCAWLDDILELREILDTFHPLNDLRNKQLEVLVEEIGVEHAYFLLELLGDGIVTPREFSKIMANRRTMREFGDIPKEDWYSNLPAYLRDSATTH